MTDAGREARAIGPANDPVTAILTASLAEPSTAALAIMRLSVLDWLACGLAGRSEPVSGVVRSIIENEGGSGQACVMGGGRAPARAAAMANGATSHALDYDDTHFAHIGHPSVAVLPAAFAVAEREGASFDAMLRAALAGAEASVRFGLLFGRDHYQVGFHQTATAGAFGATIAAAQIMGLGAETVRHALGYATTRASGLKSQFGTMGKPMNAGLAAANGVEAADLARLGLISNPDAFSGPNGFLATHHADGALDVSAGFLMEAVSHKFHACCHGLHAMLEAVSALDLPASVPEVVIHTSPRWMTVCNQIAPETGLGAKFSYRTAAALRILGHDTAALETWSDALAIDPDVVALRDRISVVPDETVSEMQCVVFADGRQTNHDLAAPLDLATRTERIHAKAEVLLGKKTAQDLHRAISNGDLAAVTAVF